MLRKYKQVIEQLRHRKDDQNLIKALSQFGDLQFAIDLRAQAEENWNDALDTIFQKLHSLNNYTTIKVNLNEQHSLIACTLLYKLSKHCFYSQLDKQ